MITRMVVTVSGTLIAGLLLFTLASPRADNEDGVVRVKSAYPLAETVNRLKKDVADKGIMFFSEIDQSELAAKAGIKLLPLVMSGRSILILIGLRAGTTLKIAGMPSRWLRWSFSPLLRA